MPNKPPIAVLKRTAAEIATEVLSLLSRDGRRLLMQSINEYRHRLTSVFDK